MKNKYFGMDIKSYKRFFTSLALILSVTLFQFKMTAGNRPSWNDSHENELIEKESSETEQNNNNTAEIEIFELPLPELPSTLTTPTERAGYIIEHFWDALDFNDQKTAGNGLFMEQNFANFISVFPFADEKIRKNGAEKLMEKASQNLDSYRLLVAIAEKYLYEPESPVYSEEYYELFLEPVVSGNLLTSEELLRPTRHLEEINKNRVGTQASDFKFTLRNGENTSLLSLPGSEYILIVFYDPDCQDCKKVMGMFESDSLLNNLMEEGKLTMVAVYSGEEKELWEKTSSGLPEKWTVGYDPGTVEDEDIYVLPTTPTLYLLDKEKKVILKNPKVSVLMDFLFHNH